jgi:hypothetical protein
MDSLLRKEVVLYISNIKFTFDKQIFLDSLVYTFKIIIENVYQIFDQIKSI